MGLTGERLALPPRRGCTMATDRIEIREGDLFRKVFLLALVLAISAAFLATIQGFLMALLLAALASGLCQPVYTRLKKLLRGREGAASGITILLVLVVNLLFLEIRLPDIGGEDWLADLIRKKVSVGELYKLQYSRSYMCFLYSLLP